MAIETWPRFRYASAGSSTSCPPLRSAISTSPRSSGRPEARENLGGDRLELRALIAGVADRAHEEVVAAGRAEPLELFRALLGRADDTVPLRERLEVLRVTLAEDTHPRSFRGFKVPPHRDEDEVCCREPGQRAAGAGRRGPDLVEALRVAVGPHDVRHPAVALPARTRQRRVGAAADPDRRKLAGRLGIERHGLQARESASEGGGRVTPEGADHVDALGHPRPALLVGHTAELELLRILAPDADAEDEPAA